MSKAEGTSVGDILQKEKLFLIRYMEWRSIPFPKVNTKLSGKSVEKSISARKEGNLLYIEGMSSFENYEKIWNLYSESIAFAPTDSEELALGYGNRSAFLFHINAYEACIMDCDRAMSVTSYDYLKVKLLCRKAKSLAKLNRSPVEVSKEALQLLEKLTLAKKTKDDYIAQLSQLSISSTVSMMNKNKMSEQQNSCDPNNLLDFERSQEVPYASKSVAIQYSKKWGRHIVAVEDIQAGEIIAIEQNCLSFPHGESKYKFCGNCMKYLLCDSFIPCEYCAYNVYCNESCRKEAWEKYHQFECCIMVFLNSSDVPRMLPECLVRALRMSLLGIYQAGGLKQMKEELLEIENTKDARTKGFSNGIFEEGKVKSLLSLSFDIEEDLEEKIRLLYLSFSAYVVHLLAKYTTFFGKKMNFTESKIFLNKDRLFTAALLLRCFHIISANLHVVTPLDDESDDIKRYYMVAFGQLFNHSCDPNVTNCSTQYCKTIYYACYPIQKGTQLFVAYGNNTFLRRSKESRQEMLKNVTNKNFICECIACKENWSSTCLPSLKVVLQIMPSLWTPELVDIVKAGMKKVDPKGEFGPLTLKRKLILHYLTLLATNFTVHCQEYFSYLQYLKDIYTTFDF